MIQSNSHTAEEHSHPLVIQVANPQQDGMLRVEVTEQRCIFGSSDSANVTLKSASLNPCHCEIVRGTHGVFVRRLGDDIQINGMGLPEAWLYKGDRIAFGGVDVEILELGSYQIESQSVIGEKETDQHAAVAAPFNDSIDEFEESENTASAASVASVTAVEKVTEPTVTQQVLESSVWVDDNDDNQQNDRLSQLYDSAVDETPVVQVSKDVEPARSAAQTWVADSIAPQLLKPNTDPSQFSYLPQPSAADANRILDQIEGAPNFVDDSSARQTVVDSIPATIEQETTSEQELEIPDVASVLSQLESHEPDSSDTDCVDLESVDSEPVSADPQPEWQPQPDAQLSAEPCRNESVADVLARMQAAGALDNPLPVQEKSAAAAVAEHIESGPADSLGDSTNNVGTDGVGDSSVQDYMRQLMQRLNGAAEEQDLNSVEPAAEKLVKAHEDNDLTPENPLTASEFQPKATPREKTSTMTALRQVANQSVENAILTCEKAKNSKTNLVYVAGAGCCLFASAVLFTLSRGNFDVSFILAIVFAIGCVASVFMYLSNDMADEKARKSSEDSGDRNLSSPNQGPAVHDSSHDNENLVANANV